MIIYISINKSIKFKYGAICQRCSNLNQSDKRSLIWDWLLFIV